MQLGQRRVEYLQRPKCLCKCAYARGVIAVNATSPHHGFPTDKRRVCSGPILAHGIPRPGFDGAEGGTHSYGGRRQKIRRGFIQVAVPLTLRRTWAVPARAPCKKRKGQVPPVGCKQKAPPTVII